MSTAPLYEQGSIVLDAAGYGIVTLRPAQTTWTITAIAVQVSGAGTVESIARVYYDSTIQGKAFDTTSTGNSDTSTGISYVIQAGQPFIVEWTGGAPGALATVLITGTKTAYGSGFKAVGY